MYKSLLDWATKNAETSSSKKKLEPIDPEIIEMILGRPDSTLMKEAIATAIDTTKEPSERAQALEELIFFLEPIDNSADLEPLNLWDPLMSLYNDSNAEVSQNALWCTAVALQNNPKAIDAFMNKNGFEVTVSMITQPNFCPKLINIVIAIINMRKEYIAKFEENGVFKILNSLEDEQYKNKVEHLMSIIKNSQSSM